MQEIIRVTKEFNFEMAHALHNYDGACKNIHGHTYRLFVSLIGTTIDEEKNSKFGMAIDFGDLKRIVNEIIVQKFDHALLLSKTSAQEIQENPSAMFDKCIVVDYQPTCENIIIDFSKRLKNAFPPNVKLYSLKLYETITSFSEWYAKDNQ